MQNRYSIAISPPDEVISSVKNMKENLNKEVGWFNSKNSMAHITINEFITSELQLENIKKQLTYICNGFEPIKVHMNSFGSYNNGAFYIAPDDCSKMGLKTIMRHVNNSLCINDKKTSNDPHMSIARRLSPEALGKAKKLFDEVDLNFVCDHVVIRQFNPKIKQFEIIERFPFNNKPSAVQGRLF
ncbi:2'-5' RNA ligase family protein [Flavobacterium sp. SM15]|uniref:2'-5' RNA ligase family protein n=1 Tax=Flavobacterium sp. SM15 TaxID=2908005 RepID=UPI001EDA5389|nr:2'-5' RNA ligase family protein [Flavobacterium sp. SM15]MCG2612347.1 2'-5' RNA ligase family protein [Flavobacterium sp. SM15]